MFKKETVYKKLSFICFKSYAESYNEKIFPGKKYLKKEPRPATLLKTSLKHRRFSLNFAKFYEHLFCRTPLGDCFCILENN